MATSMGLQILPVIAFRGMFSPRFLSYRSTPRSIKGRKTSSQQWLKRQWSDPYVKKARTENYRCRSAFKLLELDDKFHFLQPGAVVIDCGAAPGSWTQVAVEKACPLNEKNDQTTQQPPHQVQNEQQLDIDNPEAGLDSQEAEQDQKKGLVIGIDLEHMLPIEGAYLLYQSDFTSQETQQKILQILDGRSVDVVLSDMAPRATGQKSLDHDLIIDLCFSVLMFARRVLRPGGDLVCKLWQGGEQQKLEKAMNSLFEKVKLAKPNSSRTDSAEAFLVGTNFMTQKR